MASGSILSEVVTDPQEVMSEDAPHRAANPKEERIEVYFILISCNYVCLFREANFYKGSKKPRLYNFIAGFGEFVNHTKKELLGKNIYDKADIGQLV